MNERNRDVASHGSSRRLGRWVAVFGVVLLTFSAGYLFGVWEKTKIPPQEAIQQIVRQADDQSVDQKVDFSLYWDVWNRIKRDYVRQPVDDSKLFYGSIAGLVQGTGDPYSIFFDPEQTKAFNDSLNGSFGGVGMELGEKDGQVVVIAPVPNTPAEKAGILAGDAILAVDDQYIDGKTVDEVVLLVRGDPGTSVKLLLQRGDTEPFEKTIERAIIQPAVVKVEYKDQAGKSVAVVSISKFTPDSSVEFESIVNDLVLKKPDLLILDVRNNPGGFVTPATDIASEWIDHGPIFFEQKQDGSRIPTNSTGSGRLADQKTVVLVNQGSASASEILAGALQDYGKATILGETSFGKGSVQDIHFFNDGSSLKLTISLWLTPKGRTIDKTGITPDQVVDYTQADATAGTDPQLEAALKLVESE